MSGTNHSKHGLRRLTRLGPPFTWRLVGFVALVGLGAVCIGWIDANTSHRMEELEESFAAVKTERFYNGVYMRTTLRELNEALLRFHLKREEHELSRFRADAVALQSWISTRKGEVSTDAERELFEQLVEAYDTYLRESADLQKRPGLFGATRKQVDAVNEQLRRNSATFFDLCEELIRVQHEAFGTFLSNSEQTLSSFQQLIQLSIVLLATLTFSVIFLVYRGMIAPLRAQLSESQATIERQEKLVALGGLAAGVAHEIRNPLTAIKFRLFSLKKEFPTALAESEDATVIGSEINRLERIVKDFLNFARPTEPELLEVPVTRLLKDVSGLLQSQLNRASIELRVECPREVRIRADAQQMKQVLINLIQNAAESIGHHGTVTLRAVETTTHLAGLRRRVTCIEVADSGKGIPSEVRKRLFDPFFTTKERGTGLGLSIAARIVDKHGGELRYETEINRGTLFRIVLPRAPHHERQPVAH